MLKAIVLIMVMVHRGPGDVPSAMFFDTPAACTDEMVKWTSRVIDADGEAKYKPSVNVAPKGSVPVMVPMVQSERYLGWCQPTELLKPEWRYKIVQAAHLPD